MLFGSFATIKTISDHCGYVFPWDPFRLVNNNGAVFHDLHHQSWGLKVRLFSLLYCLICICGVGVSPRCTLTVWLIVILQYNFSTYTVFWDNLLGTTWADKEGADKRYQRVWELTAKRSQETGKDVAVMTDRATEKAVAEGRKEI